MRVLFDVSHPAHVHLFKNAIRELDNNGASVRVTSRKKDLTTELLDAYEIPHIPISAKGETKVSLASEWIVREFRTLQVARSFDPDVIVSRLNPPAAHAARVLGSKSIIFDDSEKALLPAKLTHPFADVICTPQTFSRNLGDNQHQYNGFHELAYLHPNRFTPDERVLTKHGIDADETYSVVRFVSWGAHHDVNQRGLSRKGKSKLVEVLSEWGEVYITAERELPAEFEKYRLPVPPKQIHQLLYHADMYVGDSQTMATEAAVLGTPAVRCNTFAGENDMSNFIKLEEEYGLLYSTADEEAALQQVSEMIEEEHLQLKWDERRQRLIEANIDVTAFMLDLIQEVSPA